MKYFFSIMQRIGSLQLDQWDSNEIHTWKNVNKSTIDIDISTRNIYNITENINHSTINENVDAFCSDFLKIKHCAIVINIFLLSY